MQVFLFSEKACRFCAMPAPTRQPLFLCSKSGKSLTYGIGETLTDVSVRLSPLLRCKAQHFTEEFSVASEKKKGLILHLRNQPLNCSLPTSSF